MQGLEIKYGQFSAHSLYLQQQNLLEEDQVYHHSALDLEMDMDELQFTENHKDQQSQRQTISYREYLQGLIIFHKSSKGRSSTLFRIIKLSDYLFGDIFLYDYHNNQQQQRKTLQFIIINKWRLTLRLLQFFIIAIFLPQISILLIGYLLYLIRQQNDVQSQIIRSAQLIASIGTLVNRLKVIYCDLGSYSKRAAQIFTISIDSLVQCLQQQYCLQGAQNLQRIDRLNTTLFRVQQKLRKLQYSQAFIEEQNQIKRIYYFIKIKTSNTLKKELQSSLQSIIDRYQKDKNNKRPKQIIYHKKPQIYFNKLFQQLKSAYSNEDNHSIDAKHKQNILSILHKQYQFKKIIDMKRITQSNNFHQTNIPKIQSTPDQTLPSFQNVKKQYSSSLIYQNDSIHNFEVKDRNEIKNKLQLILQRHEQQKRKADQPQLLLKEQKIIIQEKPQRSIFSFGIPIQPPARDMSAYYIE